MTNEQIGTAYGFFYSSATKERIETEFLNARDFARTPSELEIELRQGIKTSDFVSQPELRELAEAAILSRDNYTLIGTFPSQDNKRTAEELRDVLNAMYGSELQDSFKRGGKKFLAGFAYKDESTGIYEILD